MNESAQRYRLHPNVELGVDSEVGDYVVLGQPPRGRRSGELPTLIGPEAVIRSHTVIYADNRIGQGLNTGHAVMIRESNDIGDGVSIGTHSIIEHHVRIGNRVRIHSGVFIPEFSVLEDDVWVGPGVVFTNAVYPLGHGAKDRLEGPLLKDGAIVGAHATLLPGVTVGCRALVGGWVSGRA